VLIFGGGGEGVRIRLGDFDFPRPKAEPAAVSEKGLKVSSLDIVGPLLSPLFSELTRSDPVVLWLAGAVPEKLCVSVGRSASGNMAHNRNSHCRKNGEPRAEALIEALSDCYRIAKCEMKESETNGIGE
jgi:hypothetical protein